MGRQIRSMAAEEGGPPTSPHRVYSGDKLLTQGLHDETLEPETGSCRTMLQNKGSLRRALSIKHSKRTLKHKEMLQNGWFLLPEELDDGVRPPPVLLPAPPVFGGRGGRGVPGGWGLRQRDWRVRPTAPTPPPALSRVPLHEPVTTGGGRGVLLPWDPLPSPPLLDSGKK